MRELLEFIFTLESKAGQSIVWIIVCLSALGLLNFLWHLLYKLPWEKRNLNRARGYFKEEPQLDESDLLLDELREAGIADSSEIYRRIDQLIEVKNNQGVIDQDALAEILAGRESIKASLARHILGTVIILGLIGTLWGLSTAIIEVRPLITDIEQLDDLEQMAQVIRQTLAGMSTAFATTLAGLFASLGLGIFSWLFSRQQTVFLTEFEEFVETTVMCHFTQTDLDAIQSAAEELANGTKMLKFATNENVALMRQAIQQLTDTSWEARLEQQYVLAENFGETATNLLKSLEDIRGYQFLIKDAVKAFEDLTGESITQMTQSQSQLRETLVDALPKLAEESQDLRTVIQDYQSSQAEFINDLSRTINTGNDELVQRLTSILRDTREQISSIASQQQGMVEVLRQLSSELHIRSSLEAQNQIFEKFQTDLSHFDATAEQLPRLLENIGKQMLDLRNTLQELSQMVNTQLDQSDEKNVLYRILFSIEELNGTMKKPSIRLWFQSLFSRKK